MHAGPISCGAAAWAEEAHLALGREARLAASKDGGGSLVVVVSREATQKKWFQVEMITKPNKLNLSHGTIGAVLNLPLGLQAHSPSLGSSFTGRAPVWEGAASSGSQLTWQGGMGRIPIQMTSSSCLSIWGWVARAPSWTVALLVKEDPAAHQWRWVANREGECYAQYLSCCMSKLVQSGSSHSVPISSLESWTESKSAPETLKSSWSQVEVTLLMQLKSDSTVTCNSQVPIPTLWWSLKTIICYHLVYVLYIWPMWN